VSRIENSNLAHQIIFLFLCHSAAAVGPASCRSPYSLPRRDAVGKGDFHRNSMRFKIVARLTTKMYRVKDSATASRSLFMIHWCVGYPAEKAG